MDWEKLPIDGILNIIKNEKNPNKAFEEIINQGKKNLNSDIWNNLTNFDIEKDILSAYNWISKELNDYPDTKGIYLGLDTLNMDNGKGHNVKIEFSSTCNPRKLKDEWTYDCEYYGDDHLIEGIFEMWKEFSNKEKWSKDEIWFVEYVIFLGYSGIILKEALLKIDNISNFLSIWGFHDGDIAYLIQSIKGNKKILGKLIDY